MITLTFKNHFVSRFSNLKSTRIKIGFLLLIGTLSLIGSHAQFHEWTIGMGGASNDRGLTNTVDPSGNVYTSGYFEGTVDFDPGPGTINFSSKGGKDIFVCKADPSGNILWAKQVGGSGDEIPYGIKLDNTGNIIITGTFESTADFDPGPGNSSLSSAGGRDIFIAKLNTSGDLVWAKRMGALGGDKAFSLDVDGAGNIFTTGSYSGPVDFDPGNGNFTMTSLNFYDIFISKLDQNGNFQWAKSIGGNVTEDGYSLAVGQDGSVYCAGRFTSTVDFDPGPGFFNLTSEGSSDIFICKLDAQGDFLWANQTGNAGTDHGVSLAIDQIGNVYATGFFSGNVDFDPGPGTELLISRGMRDIFVSKYGPSGNYIWAHQIGGSLDDQGTFIHLDDSANVYCTGFFSSNVDFDPGPDVGGVFNMGDEDAFLLKLDSDGNFRWAGGMGGSAKDNGKTIATDAMGNVYFSGFYQGTADFDPGDNTYHLTSAGTDDIFITKFSPTETTTSRERYTPSRTSIYPNPNQGHFYIDLGTGNEDMNYTVFSTEGKRVRHGKTQNQVARVDLSQLPGGLYLIHLGEGEDQTWYKVLKQ